jgi:DnaJ family protein C protein 13
VRAKAAELFNKMMADKLVGPKVKITLSKFLPTIFMDAMRENTEVSVYMFEGKGHEGMTMYTTGHRLQKCKYKSPRKLYNI